jgi:hypothetical protein
MIPFSNVEAMPDLRDVDLDTTPASGATIALVLVDGTWQRGTVTTASGDWEWAGDWDSQVEYVEGQVVGHEGSSYVATGTTEDDEPPGSPWALIASAGDPAAAITSIDGGEL